MLLIVSCICDIDLDVWLMLDTVLKEEICTATQLIGMTDLMRDASPRYLNTAGLDRLLPPDYDGLQRGSSGPGSKL